MLDFLLSDRVSQVCAGLILLGLFSSSGTIAENQQQAKLISTQRRSEQFTIQQQSLFKETANQRYRAGCVPLFAVDSNNQPIALSEGMAAVDANSKNSLPAGTIVCDSLGNTGQLQFHPTNGSIVVGEIRGIADPEVVRESLTRIGIPQDSALITISEVQ